MIFRRSKKELAKKRKELIETVGDFLELEKQKRGLLKQDQIFEKRENDNIRLSREERRKVKNIIKDTMKEADKLIERSKDLMMKMDRAIIELEMLL